MLNKLFEHPALIIVSRVWLIIMYILLFIMIPKVMLSFTLLAISIFAIFVLVMYHFTKDDFIK